MINISTTDLLIDYFVKANIPLTDILWYLSIPEPRDISSEACSDRGRSIYQKLNFNSQSTSIGSMLEAGIHVDEILWYFHEARPRDFKADGDVIRAQKIFKSVLGWAPNAK
jgi:hypothetical protein